MTDKTDKPNNVIRLRDHSENVLETLERAVARMRGENPTGLGYDLGVLITMSKEGRLEVCRLGSETNRCAVLGAMVIAQDILISEVME